MPRPAIVKAERFLKRGLAVEKGKWDNISLAIGGIALGISFAGLMIILTGGLSVALNNPFVFALCVAGGKLAVAGLIMSEKVQSPEKKKTSKALNLIAGIPMWYIIAGVTYVMSIM